jgi:hypothetical protein
MSKLPPAERKLRPANSKLWPANYKLSPAKSKLPLARVQTGEHETIFFRVAAEGPKVAPVDNAGLAGSAKELMRIFENRIRNFSGILNSKGTVA